jgi:hypothetical protein
MDGERPNPAPHGRELVGAWLLCVVIALLALGLTNNLRGGVPPAAEITGLPPCASVSGPACQPSADADSRTNGTVAGLHRLTLPARREGDRRRPG